MTALTIVEFDLVDHGIDYEQYFQGCGLSFTDYEAVVTGIGDNPAEAIDDCLEQLGCNGWDVEGMEKRILAEHYPHNRKLPTKPKVLRSHGDEAHYYMSIRVK